MRLMRFGVWLSSGLIILAPAVGAAPVTYVLEGQESTLSFEGRSTLHDFTGTTHALSGRMVYDAEGPRLIAPADIRLPVAHFDTGNAARDKAMRGMFEAAQFPDIHIVLASLTPLEAGHYRLAGQATIRAVTQPVECDVWATVTPEGITATGEAHLTTKQFGLRPPSVMGIIRVRQDIVVRFISRWKPGV